MKKPLSANYSETENLELVKAAIEGDRKASFRRIRLQLCGRKGIWLFL